MTFASFIPSTYVTASSCPHYPGQGRGVWHVCSEAPGKRGCRKLEGKKSTSASLDPSSWQRREGVVDIHQLMIHILMVVSRCSWGGRKIERVARQEYDGEISRHTVAVSYNKNEMRRSFYSVNHVTKLFGGFSSVATLILLSVV